ncbi:hypothetical protein [Caproicibacter sp.]|uniref:hypothetical protein n=1 Tax=Caproicibacter sp. TaxID=2814884 RepID=UPI0039890AB3
MFRSVQKGLCMCFSFVFVAFLASFPVHASAQSNFEVEYSSKVPTHLYLPVGAHINFYSPPLKKEEHPCFAAGNGTVLHTVVAGKPIQHSDGNIRYSFGFTCCQAGETGIYINWNGRTVMLYSIQVFDTKPTTGFPIKTTFQDILYNQKITKVVILEGDSDLSSGVTIKDPAQITHFLSDLAPERLYHSFDTHKYLGNLFSLDFYINGQKGYYRYILGKGFYQVDGFSVPLPTGRCFEENFEKIYQLIGNWYENAN